MTTAKIAVSVPRKTLGAVEKRRRALGMTRSAVVTAALDAWLSEQSMTAEEREYMVAYLREPETEEERSDGRELAEATLSRWERWDVSGGRGKARRGQSR
jgi:hypothetical protein